MTCTVSLFLGRRLFLCLLDRSGSVIERPAHPAAPVIAGTRHALRGIVRRVVVPTVSAGAFDVSCWMGPHDRHLQNSEFALVGRQAGRNSA